MSTWWHGRGAVLIIKKIFTEELGMRTGCKTTTTNETIITTATGHAALPIIPPAAASTMAAVLFQSSWYSSFVPLRFVHTFCSVASCVSHLLFCKAACKQNDDQIMVAERGMMLWVANVWDKKALWKLRDLFSVLCFTSNMYHSLL